MIVLSVLPEERARDTSLALETGHPPGIWFGSLFSSTRRSFAVVVGLSGRPPYLVFSVSGGAGTPEAGKEVDAWWVPEAKADPEGGTAGIESLYSWLLNAGVRPLDGSEQVTEPTISA